MKKYFALIGIILVLAYMVSYLMGFKSIPGAKFLCEQIGYEWKNWAFFGEKYRCLKRAEDALKVCTDGSQCSYGICLDKFITNVASAKEGNCLDYREDNGWFGTKEPGIKPQISF